MKNKFIAALLLLVCLASATTVYANSFDLPEINPDTGEVVSIPSKVPAADGEFEAAPIDFGEVDIPKNKIKASACKLTLSAASYVYNGKKKTPTVTVKDSKNKVVPASNYTVKYQTGRKNVGKYTVTVTFKGDYTGSLSKSFTIKPKGTTLSAVTAGKKAFTAKWKKQSTQTTGYQLQYSTDKNFKKGAKTVTIKKNKTVKTTVKKLKANKKHFVRIRTYTTVGKTKYYSSWSKSKSLTPKK